MLIHPVEPSTGYHPRRHPESAARQGPESETAADGIIRGRVEELLDDGQVRVNAAGRLFQFLPPRPLARGELIDLTVVSREPHLVLELADGSASDAPPPELSRAATLIARLTAPGAPRPGIIHAAAPLFARPPENGAGVAPALAAAISASGLFYESHQAEWVNGIRTLAQLSAEPQARLQPAALIPKPEIGETEHLLPAAVSSGPQTAARQLHTHPDALPLLRAQLDALDSRRLYWYGDLWPGQPAAWEIVEYDEHAGNATRAADQKERTWQTRVDLELPALGAITAVVESGRNSARIRIHASNAGSATMLGTETGDLRSALAAAGVTVTELAVDDAASAPKLSRSAR